MKEFNKITPRQIAEYGVQALADRPNSSGQYGVGGLSPVQLKLWFDRLCTLVAERQNELYDTLASEDAAEYIRIALDAYEVDSLDELVASFTDGRFVSSILKVFPGAGATEPVTLQSAVNQMMQAAGEATGAANGAASAALTAKGQAEAAAENADKAAERASNAAALAESAAQEAAVVQHNAAPDAHADIRQEIVALENSVENEVATQLGTLEARLDTLDLRYGANIEGTSFAVYFASLDGVEVTGVWNESGARVEF